VPKRHFQYEGAEENYDVIMILQKKEDKKEYLSHKEVNKYDS